MDNSCSLEVAGSTLGCMSTRSLPPELRSVPFRTSTASALGVPDGCLYGVGAHKVTHGVLALQAPGAALADQARAMQLALPEEGAFSHVTAARLHGLPLPAWLEQRPGLDVCTPSAMVRRRRPGWIGHRGAESRVIVDVAGVRTIDVVDTWIDLAGLMVGRRPALSHHDLVVTGDEVLGRVLGRLNVARGSRKAFRPHLDAELVAAAYAIIDATIDAKVRPRGKRALLTARDRIRAGVKSPQESRARLVLVDAGFPAPLINVPIHPPAGDFLGEGDLVWLAERVVAEYQGRHHADPARASHDEVRNRGLRDEQWDVHPLWAEDLWPGVRRRQFLLRLALALGLDRSTVPLS